jgi:uncharacterized SAM-binding protein YcdF (DUF218 family)
LVAERRSRKIKFAVLTVFLVALAISHSLWLGWMGAFLIEGEEPSRADVIVVLAGDPYGHRILKGAELAKSGYASKVLVSGAPGFYDLHESDLAIPFVVRRGYPAAWFIPFPHEGHSTDEEARAIFSKLTAIQANHVMVVTSNYHTRRALRTLRARWPGIDVRMVAAPDEFFSPSGWWHSREGRKTFFLEWTKTLASLAGM